MTLFYDSNSVDCYLGLALELLLSKRGNKKKKKDEKKSTSFVKGCLTPQKYLELKKNRTNFFLALHMEC